MELYQIKFKQLSLSLSHWMFTVLFLFQNPHAFTPSNVK